MEGQIVFYHVERGFGFVTCGVKQVFFHVKYFAKGFQPVVGRRVKFDLAPGQPGKEAMAVNLEYTDLGGDETLEKLNELARMTSLAGNESGDPCVN